MLKNKTLANSLIVAFMIQNISYGLLFAVIFPLTTTLLGSSSLHSTMIGFSPLIPLAWGLGVIFLVISIAYSLHFDKALATRILSGFGMALWIFAMGLYMLDGQIGVAVAVTLPQVVIWGTLVFQTARGASENKVLNERKS